MSLSVVYCIYNVVRFILVQMTFIGIMEDPYRQSHMISIVEMKVQVDITLFFIIWFCLVHHL